MQELPELREGGAELNLCLLDVCSELEKLTKILTDARTECYVENASAGEPPEAFADHNRT